jgi:hypothetical protein
MRRWTSAIVEAVLGTVIITAIGILIPGRWGLLEMHPHPLWIVVLAIAVRYGSPVAYVASGLAAVSYLLAAVLQPGGPVLPDTSLLVEPFLFLVVGGAVGEIVSVHLGQLDEATVALQADAQTRADLDERLHTALAVKGELEKRIVSQPASVATLYTLAKQLDVRESVAIYPISLDLMTEYLGAESCALYKVDGQTLRLIEGRPRVVAERPRTLLSTSGLAARALLEERVVTAWEPPAAAAATQEGVLAGPLRGEHGAIVGIVVVEALPFLRLTPTTLRLFELLLDWTSTALKNALRFEQADAGNIRDGRSGLYLPAYTRQVLDEELQRARRYELPLSIVTLQLDAADGAQTMAADTIGQLDEQATVVAILPMTDERGAEIIGQRLADNWAASAGITAPIAMGVAEYSPEIADEAAFVTCALDARRMLIPMANAANKADSAEDAAD